MNFDIDDEQRSFAQHAHDFFSEQAGPATARRLLDEPGPPAPGPSVLAEFGFSSLTIPQTAGGVGAELLNLALVAGQAPASGRAVPRDRGPGRGAARR